MAHSALCHKLCAWHTYGPGACGRSSRSLCYSQLHRHDCSCNFDAMLIYIGMRMEPTRHLCAP
jgi:hypothetical protein